MPTIRLQKQEDLEEVVVQVLKNAKAQSSACVIALHGELGAGKTTLVQMIAKVLGITEIITSPTFVVMKQYQLKIPKYGIEQLVHIDAYRIETEAEMKPLHFDEILKTPGSLICIEWAEKIKNLLPEKLLDITINITDQAQGREIIIHDL